MPILAALLVSAALFAESYANVTYAEGGTFRVVRGGKTTSWDVGREDVFGLEIKTGDLISTGPGTILEISIHPISASVQIAENTSFSCDADATGAQSKGELYYGRVHAKVAKLVGGASYRISSPSLVAGVRGTDFGLDVIAARQTDANAADSSASVLSRVFCFEGSVAVTPADKPALEAVVVSTGQMVELATSQASSAEPPKLVPKPINEEVREYWEDKPQVGYLEEGEGANESAVAGAVAADTEGDWRQEGPYLVKERAWPRAADPTETVRNVKVPNWAATALMIAGTTTSSALAIYSHQSGDNAWFVESGYSAGVVMAGSGALLALFSALFN